MKVQTRAGVVCGLTLFLLSSVALSSGYNAAPKNRANRQTGNGAQARPPADLEAIALKVVAQLHGVPLADLTVENSTVAAYPLSGKKANLFRVGRKSTDDLWEIALDDNGLTVDQSALAAGEEDARTAKYGKLSPFLWGYLSHASPDQEIEVTIFVALGPYTDRPRDPVAMDSEKLKRMTEQERQDYVRAEQDFDLRLKAYNIARAQKAIDPVVQRLKKLGYAPEILTDTGGYLTAKMKPAMIRECQTWPEIRQVIYEPNFKATGARSALGSSRSAAPPVMLDISRPLIGADLVENRGINGQNAPLAQVESGNNTGRIFNDVGQNNPYLSGIVQDGTFLCSGSPSDHSTAVAGIIHSNATLPPVFRGIAPGAGLLATGVCDGNVMNTSNRIDYAISQGALVINHSYGHDTGSLTSNPLAQSDQFLDSKVSTDRVVQVSQVVTKLHLLRQLTLTARARPTA
jgi:hypothetical protein